MFKIHLYIEKNNEVWNKYNLVHQILLSKILAQKLATDSRIIQILTGTSKYCKMVYVYFYRYSLSPVLHLYN